MLVPPAAPAWGSPAPGIALCGAYVAMLLVMYLLTRSLFKVGFEWLRLAKLAAILAGVAVSGELLLPTAGFAGPRAARAVARARAGGAAGDALLPPARARAGAQRCVADGRRRVAAFRAGHGEVEAYAEDPLKDV